MYLIINRCVTAVKVSNFSGHYLRNRSTLDIGVLGYIGVVQHKLHSPEVLSIPPGTPCVYIYIYIYIYIHKHTHIYVYMPFVPIGNMLITPHAACYFILNSTYLLLCYQDSYK